ncbi:helix-turn-helix transcriptional regulator [Metabacillus iocasae]|uniref:ArsR family transcriptional regulator n=1 Tax=Priestia iocasae TaxID=2291674 RepID=A0ABS2QQE5_9BACI|nr:helix-turn-helix domain-containing protein [Metabacillus iocasae]MBM7701543.1 putative ArsR family transcriptional regulator [Metabacillus iocasae]
MTDTLKVTSVLSDPTRFHIYEYITHQLKDVTVQEIAETFHIHPNVARLHLSKLEEVNFVSSHTKKTGKGGRPSRFYRMSHEAIQLSFPYRDYQLLSTILLQTLSHFGEEGLNGLHKNAYDYGRTYFKQKYAHLMSNDAYSLSIQEKVNLIKKAAKEAGLLPIIEFNHANNTLYFQINNCPFKELAIHQQSVCVVHNAFLKGMFDLLFEDVDLIAKNNIAVGCEACTYQVAVTN